MSSSVPKFGPATWITLIALLVSVIGIYLDRKQDNVNAENELTAYVVEARGYLSQLRAAADAALRQVDSLEKKLGQPELTDAARRCLALLYSLAGVDQDELSKLIMIVEDAANRGSDRADTHLSAADIAAKRREQRIAVEEALYNHARRMTDYQEIRANECS